MKKITSFVIAMILGLMAVSFWGGEVYAEGENGASGGASTSSSAGGKCESTFLGLRPWYMGVVETDDKGNCVVRMQGDSGNGGDIAKFVWKIALNIIADVSLMVGYVSAGFIVYGGYKYIMSGGEAKNVMLAKTTITNAVIGLIIAILSTVIVNTIIVVLNSAVK